MTVSLACGVVAANIALPSPCSLATIHWKLQTSRIREAEVVRKDLLPRLANSVEMHLRFRNLVGHLKPTIIAITARNLPGEQSSLLVQK